MGGDWKEMVLAAEKGDVELVSYHLQMGVDPNYQHPEFLTTAMIEAAQAGQAESVRLLLENGADPTIKGIFDRKTALEVAREFKRKEVIKVLEKHFKTKN